MEPLVEEEETETTSSKSSRNTVEASVSVATAVDVESRDTEVECVRTASSPSESVTTSFQENTEDSSMTEADEKELDAPEAIIPNDSSESMTVQEEEPCSTCWSVQLASPTVACFSPSGPLHGYGLQSARQRGLKAANCGRRCVGVMQGVTTVYDTYANALKSLQLLQLTTEPSVLPLAKQVQDHVRHASSGWMNLASTLQQTIVTPWQGHVQTQRDVVPAVWEQYTVAKDRCIEMRRRALEAYRKYEQARLEAERAVEEWKTTAQTGSSSSQLSPPQRVVNKCHEVVKRQHKYQRLVELENEAARQCQRLEGMALESMQLLEEDRLAVVCQGLIKVLLAQRAFVNEMIVAVVDEAPPSPPQQTLGETMVTPEHGKQKGRKGGLANLLKSSSSNMDRESAGVMDAETLGLPEEIGKLRDQVRAELASRKARIQVVRVVATFLENVAAASTKLGLGLQQHMPNENGKKMSRPTSPQSESLNTALMDCEGPRTLRLWDGVMKLLGQEAESALALASALRSVRAEKLDTVLLYGDKSIKAAAETDDSMWKQLVEAARSQSKAENRYRQTTVRQAKVRERVTSTDSASGDSGSGTNPSPKRVSKHLANMFSILPDGGNQAMKMLTPGARASIAHRTLEEADQKESKGRLLLDSAVEATSVALEAYRTSAEALSNQLQQEDKKGWEDIKTALESFLTQAETMRASREDILSSLKPIMETDALAGATVDVNEWCLTIQKEILSKMEGAEETTSNEKNKACTGFMLVALIKESEAVNKVLGAETETQEESTSNTEVEDSVVEEDDEVDTEVVDDEMTVHLSRSADGEESLMSATSERASTPEKQSQKWMRRSQSAPAMADEKVDNSNLLNRKVSLGHNIDDSDKEEKNSGTKLLDTETKIFLNFFWRESVEPKTVPAIVESYSCSFRDKSQRLPFQYGRLFVTSERFLFVSWTGRRLILKWPEVVDLEPIKNFVNTGDDSLMLTYKKETEEPFVILGGLRNRGDALEVIKRLREEAKAAAELRQEEGKEVEEETTVAPSHSPVATAKVPPDKTLEKMEIVLQKHLRNISIQRFYEIVWAEGNKTDAKPLYGPWLGKVCMDIQVGDWEFEEALGPWCGERYPQKRRITFKVKRRTHLYIGPPIANVVQTHFCRVEGNDRCVLAKRVEFEGIPYSDTFAVEIRWVATREGANDILIEVGLAVDFKKNTFLKSKIRAGTIEETKPVQHNLFETVKAACIADGGVEAEEEEKVEEEEVKEEVAEKVLVGKELRFDRYTIAACGAVVVLAYMWRFLFSTAAPLVEPDSLSPGDAESLGERIDHLEYQLADIQTTLDEVLALLKDQHNQL